MARGIGSLVKSAAGSVAQIPGAEEIVLSAVRDIFKELKQLRRENERLRNEIDRLQQRLDAGTRPRAPERTSVREPRPPSRREGATTKRTAKPAPAKRSSPARRAPRRRGGILGDLLG